MATMTHPATRAHSLARMRRSIDRRSTASLRREETVCLAIAGTALITALQRRSVFWLALTVGATAMLVNRLDARARLKWAAIDVERRPDPPVVDCVDEAGLQSFPASDPPAHY